MTATTVREALRDAMAEEMRRDERVFVMGEEVAQYQGAYKVTQGLLDEFGPKRVIDTPITEYGFAGLGSGAAMGGLKPIIEFMTFNFAMQAIDHIINSAAKTNYMSGGQMRCPIVFRGPNGAASRVGAQHSQNYGPWYASVPGLIVIAPYDAADAKGLLKAAIRSDDPVVFLENELLYGQSFDVPAARRPRPADRQGADHARGQGRDPGQLLDRRRRRARGGRDAGRRGHRGRSDRPAHAAPARHAGGADSLAKTNRVVVVEEGWPTCSIASEIIAVCMTEGFDDLDAPVLRVTNEDVPLPYAANLEKLALIKADDVVKAAQGGPLSLSPTGRCATATLSGSTGRSSCGPRSMPCSASMTRSRDVVATSTQPALGAIRLAWWRDALERLDQFPPPPEPRLQAVATELLPRGISGSAPRDARRWLDHLVRRAPRRSPHRRPWRCAVRHRRRPARRKRPADRRRWTGVRARRCRSARPSPRHERLARPASPATVPAQVRPLTMLGALARRDVKRGEFVEAEATPGRAVTLLRHWWAGG